MQSLIVSNRVHFASVRVAQSSYKLTDSALVPEHPVVSSESSERSRSIKSETWVQSMIRVQCCESTIPTRKSNEYEYEYGLFLYNATLILDNLSNFVHS